MLKRDLLRLPHGDYKLKDKYGIYTLMLTKRESDWGNGEKKIIYSIREYGSLNGGSINLYEEVDDVFEDSSRYKQTVLTASAFVSGGLSVHGIKEGWKAYFDLDFLPKTTYKQWLNSLINTTNEQ